MSLFNGFNTGQWLATQHQSPYATARQWVIANPGWATSTVQRAYLAYAESQGDTLSRAEFSRYAPSKHCPLCAQHLFHCRLYDYCWLTRCPIHGCELVGQCPRCDKSWPRIASLAARHCELCGIPKWENLLGRGLSSDVIAPLDSLHQFLEASTPINCISGRRFPFIDYNEYFYYRSRCRYDSFRPISISSKFFPDFQLFFSQSFSKDSLQELGVRTTDISLAYSEVQTRTFNPKIVKARIGRRRPTSRSPSRHAICSIMKCSRQIVGFLGGGELNKHVLRIREYRYARYMAFREADMQPCRVCLAFTLWWAAVTQRYYDPLNSTTPFYYYFTEIFGGQEWPQTPDRLVSFNMRGSGDRPSHHIERIIFERSLLCLFLDFLTYSGHVCERLRCLHAGDVEQWSDKARYRLRDNASHLYAYGPTSPSSFGYCWPNIDPLSEIDCSLLEHSGCQSPKNHYVDRTEVDNLCDIQWDPGDDQLWNYEAFRALFLRIGNAFHARNVAGGYRRPVWDEPLGENAAFLYLNRYGLS